MIRPYRPRDYAIGSEFAFIIMQSLTKDKKQIFFIEGFYLSNNTESTFSTKKCSVHTKIHSFHVRMYGIRRERSNKSLVALFYQIRVTFFFLRLSCHNFLFYYFLTEAVNNHFFYDFKIIKKNLIFFKVYDFKVINLFF